MLLVRDDATENKTWKGFVPLGRTLKIFAGKVVISFGRNRTCDLLLIDIGDRIEMDR